MIKDITSNAQIFEMTKLPLKELLAKLEGRQPNRVTDERTCSRMESFLKSTNVGWDTVVRVVRGLHNPITTVWHNKWKFLIFIVAVICGWCIVHFKYGVRLGEFLHIILSLSLSLSILWLLTVEIMMYWHFSDSYISRIENETEHDFGLVEELRKYDAKVLRRCRKKIEFEVSTDEKIRFTVLLVAASTGIAKIVFDACKLGKTQPEIQFILSLPWFSDASKWAFPILCLVICVLYVDVTMMRTRRKLGRLAYVFKCAEGESIYQCNEKDN